MSIWNEFYEDKKCRICGLADLSNVNIFHDKILRIKVATVYPIVLHEEDPLPKNICRKCMNSVSSMYNDIQRVVKLQKKWAQNVRKNEPENKYLQALTLLENATQVIKTLMKASYGTALSDETINNFITNALVNDESPQTATTAADSIHTCNLNGEGCNNVSIKEEPITQEDKKNRQTPTVMESKNSCSNSPSQLSVVCNYCPLQFESPARLALHQNIHLKLKIPRLFQSKYLNKTLRRGRLISTNGSQSIRCLNCWRVFNDNKCILEHWSNAECIFYCQICGEEFEHSPKMLREHVLIDHGISYKSLKFQKDQFNKNISTNFRTKKSHKVKKDKQNTEWLDVPHKKNKTESTKTLDKAASQRKNKMVICRICSRAFQNIKACNSHMRAHKVTYGLCETAAHPDNDADVYTEKEKKEEDKKDICTPKSPEESFPESTETSTETIQKIESATTAPSSCIVYNTGKSKIGDILSSCDDTKSNSSQTTVDSRAVTICPSEDIKRSTPQATVDSRAETICPSEDIKRSTSQVIVDSRVASICPSENIKRSTPQVTVDSRAETICPSEDIKRSTPQVIVDSRAALTFPIEDIKRITPQVIVDSRAASICPSEDIKKSTPQVTVDSRAETICSSGDTKKSTPQVTADSEAKPKLPTTAPRGIRMKFVSRRSDLINSGTGIKVKSLSDLQGEKQHFVIPNQMSKAASKVQVQNVLPSTSSPNTIYTYISPYIKNDPSVNPFL